VITIFQKPASILEHIFGLLDRVPLSFLLLFARVATFSVFFRSGLVKLADWNGTLQLFENEYKVPVIPPHIAAYMSVSMELGLSSLVLIGLATRFSVLGLLGMMSVIQIFVYPMAWPDHIQWLAFMIFLLCRGPGAFSVDHLLGRWSGYRKGEVRMLTNQERK
jgi:putative oxidoreductase